MARRQGPARRRGAAPKLSLPQVVVHDLDQARAALAVAVEHGVRIELRSAPEAAAYAGVGYLHALGELAGQELLIDCGEDAGLVMAALRTGCRKLAFSGAGELSQRLAEMAAEAGAVFFDETMPAPALVLGPDDDARVRCLAWLSARPNPRAIP